MNTVASRENMVRFPTKSTDQVLDCGLNRGAFEVPSMVPFALHLSLVSLSHLFRDIENRHPGDFPRGRLPLPLRRDHVATGSGYFQTNSSQVTGERKDLPQ